MVNTYLDATPANYSALLDELIHRGGIDRLSGSCLLTDGVRAYDDYTAGDLSVLAEAVIAKGLDKT